MPLDSCLTWSYHNHIGSGRQVGRSTMAQKTGADAVFVALRAICHTITRYRTKLDAVIDDAVVAAVITSDQATAAHTFVAAAAATCAIFELVAEFNSITP
jgi:hypothetical protein